MKLKEYDNNYLKLEKEVNEAYKKFINSKFSVDVSKEQLKGLALEKANVNKKMDMLLRNKSRYDKLNEEFDSFKEEYSKVLFEYYKNKNPKIKDTNTKEKKRFNEIFEELNSFSKNEIIKIRLKKSNYKIVLFI